MTPIERDVTERVVIADNPDDTLLPIQLCVCGATFERWRVSITSESADEMPCCGRRLTWRGVITVLELVDDDAPGEPQ